MASEAKQKSSLEYLTYTLNIQSKISFDIRHCITCQRKKTTENCFGNFNFRLFVCVDRGKSEINLVDTVMAASLMRCGRFGLAHKWSPSIRLVSTSPKKNDTSVAKPLSSQVSEEVTDFSVEAVKKSKNWVSYGYSRTDKQEDRQINNATWFMGVTVAICGTIFMWSYLPDRQYLEWSQREAYVVLRNREAAGLEPISANYIDPKQVELPSDEELGDTEIII